MCCVRTVRACWPRFRGFICTKIHKLRFLCSLTPEDAANARVLCAHSAPCGRSFRGKNPLCEQPRRNGDTIRLVNNPEVMQKKIGHVNSPLLYFYGVVHTVDFFCMLSALKKICMELIDMSLPRGF